MIWISPSKWRWQRGRRKSFFHDDDDAYPPPPTPSLCVLCGRSIIIERAGLSHFFGLAPLRRSCPISRQKKEKNLNFSYKKKKRNNLKKVGWWHLVTRRLTRRPTSWRVVIITRRKWVSWVSRWRPEANEILSIFIVFIWKRRRRRLFCFLVVVSSKDQNKKKMSVCIIFKKKRRFKDDGADTTSAYKNTSSFSKLPEQSIIKQEK